MIKTEIEKKREFAREAIPHMNFLYNYAVRMTPSPQDAENLVQKTYLKAYRVWGSHESGANMRAWMFNIMKDSSLNGHQKNSSDDSYSSPDNHENTPSDKFKNMRGNDVEAAVAALPEDLRTPVILSDIEGMTYDEIAEITKVPVNVVQARLHLARRQLYKAFEETARQTGMNKRTGVPENLQRLPSILPRGERQTSSPCKTS